MMDGVGQVHGADLMPMRARCLGSIWGVRGFHELRRLQQCTRTAPVDRTPHCATVAKGGARLGELSRDQRVSALSDQHIEAMSQSRLFLCWTDASGPERPPLVVAVGCLLGGIRSGDRDSRV